MLHAQVMIVVILIQVVILIPSIHLIATNSLIWGEKTTKKKPQAILLSLIQCFSFNPEFVRQ